jgi:hypothetical protein
MEAYQIKRGVMKQIPEDLELKQVIKYILVFVAGVILGNAWRIS